MLSTQLKIPNIKVYKCHDNDLGVIFYELYLNSSFEGRYPSISEIHWRLGIILSEQALTAEV